MPRYKLTLEYDGSGLVGWQRQSNGVSVQGLLERAVERFCGRKITVHGAGRTDAGVHALGQTAHLDLPREVAPDTIRSALNHHVKPAAIAVLAVERVDEHFDARRSAKGRIYLYRILNRRPPPALERGRVWHVGPRLDADSMQDAASLLLGKHDFTTFRDSLCQAKSPVKTLDLLQVTRDGDEIRIEARARSFLHHQVRNMVGTLKLVGAGKWRAAQVKEALDACDRRAGGPTAPADGLYLVDVVYALR
jgi:tRNA pseudouridine38-40 synthase